MANLQQQLSQVSSKLNEATEVKLKALAELSQAKEESSIRQQELAQKNSDVAVSNFFRVDEFTLISLHQLLNYILPLSCYSTK